MELYFFGQCALVRGVKIDPAFCQDLFQLLVIGLERHVSEHRDQLTVERFELNRLGDLLLALGNLCLYRLITQSNDDINENQQENEPGPRGQEISGRFTHEIRNRALMLPQDRADTPAEISKSNFQAVPNEPSDPCRPMTSK